MRADVLDSARNARLDVPARGAASSASAASARSRSPTPLRRRRRRPSCNRRIQAGPHWIWRYADFLPLAGAAARRPARGLDAAGAGRPPGRAARPRARCGSRTTPPTRPTRSRTASSPSRSRVPRSSASRRSRAPRPATWPTPSPPTPPPPALDSYVFIPSNLEEQKLLTTGVYGTQPGRRRAATTTTSTGSAPSSRWRARALGVRERQPAPVLRRGLRRRSRTRSPSSSAGRSRTAVVAPIASGSLFTKIAKGFQELIELGLVEGDRSRR